MLAPSRWLYTHVTDEIANYGFDGNPPGGHVAAAEIHRLDVTGEMQVGPRDARLADLAIRVPLPGHDRPPVRRAQFVDVLAAMDTPRAVRIARLHNLVPMREEEPQWGVSVKRERAVLAYECQ